MRAINIEYSITDRSDFSLNKYLLELDRTELLSASEEVALAKKVRAGDKAAIDRLVKCNLRFVVSVAKKYQYSGMPLADLISEGNLGLIRAAEDFDETKGFKFISYAVWWIRQAIMNALGNHLRMIRLPMNMVNGTAKARKLAEQLEQTLERKPTREEILEQLDVTNPEQAFSLAFEGRVVSLDAPAGDIDDGEMELGNFVIDLGAVAPDEGLHLEDDLLERRRWLSVLNDKEREVIAGIYGFNGHEIGAKQMAREMGISVDQLRQIRVKGLRKIKKVIEERGLGCMS